VKSFFFGALTTLTLGLNACSNAPSSDAAKPKMAIGEIVSWDQALSGIVSTNTPIEVLAEGFQWAEGPAWDSKRKQLYFSDVPQNKAFKWSEQDGLQAFLDPSGILINEAEGFREAGSNGLLMTPDGQLLIANHGNRAVELMNIETRTRQTVINNYEGLSLNSPNDIARANDGTLFFTDPPYGLKGLNNSPLR